MASSHSTLVFSSVSKNRIKFEMIFGDLPQNVIESILMCHTRIDSLQQHDALSLSLSLHQTGRKTYLATFNPRKNLAIS